METITDSDVIAYFKTLTPTKKAQLAAIILLDGLDTLDRYEVLKRYL